MYLPVLSKPDFMLAGMHIDVDLVGWQLEVEHESRLALMMQNIAVSLANRMHE